jgi:hypothetical protein
MDSACRRCDRRALWAVPKPGHLVWVALVPLGAFGYATDVLSEWTRHLVSAPLAQFYAADLNVPPDHFPGDVSVLQLLGRGVRPVDPGTDISGGGYLAAFKLVFVVANLLMGVLIILFGSYKLSVLYPEPMSW